MQNIIDYSAKVAGLARIVAALLLNAVHDVHGNPARASISPPSTL